MIDDYIPQYDEEREEEELCYKKKREIVFSAPLNGMGKTGGVPVNTMSTWKLLGDLVKTECKEEIQVELYRFPK